MPAAPAPACTISEDYPLYVTLGVIREMLATSEWGTYSGDNNADHGSDLWITYGEDREGEYAVIGFALPDDFYAEVQGGRHGYATLAGFRIYRDDL